MRNGSSSFGLCSSAHLPHLGHMADDADYSYSDGEVIYEEIDNKIVRLPEEKDLTVKLVPQNIYVNNRGAVGGVGMPGAGSSTCSGHKRRHSLPNEIYASAGPTTHNPHYQEVWLIIRDLVRILDQPQSDVVSSASNILNNDNNSIENYENYNNENSINNNNNNINNNNDDYYNNNNDNVVTAENEVDEIVAEEWKKKRKKKKKEKWRNNKTRKKKRNICKNTKSKSPTRFYTPHGQYTLIYRIIPSAHTFKITIMLNRIHIQGSLKMCYAPPKF